MKEFYVVVCLDDSSVLCITKTYEDAIDFLVKYRWIEEQWVREITLEEFNDSFSDSFYIQKGKLYEREG